MCVVRHVNSAGFAKKLFDGVKQVHEYVTTTFIDLQMFDIVGADERLVDNFHGSQNDRTEAIM